MDQVFGVEQRSEQEHYLTAGGSFTGFAKEEIEGSIPERFERVAGIFARRPALRSGDTTLTYEVINKAANQLSWAILARCGEGEAPVALLLAHEAPVIVAILGILKAGKAYVALDPAYPQARLKAILEDLQNPMIVTDARHATLAEELAQEGSQVLLIDRLEAGLADKNPGLALSPDTLAGVYYTSGSTGRPKGVMRSHRSTLHRIWIETNDYRIVADDKISLLYSCSFGASVADIFNALLNGATLCLYNVKEAGLDGLATWLIQEEITFFHIPVALFRQFLDTLTGEETFPKLRQVTPSGQLFKSDIERFRKHFSPESVLISRLASSETSMISRMVIDRQTEINSNVVPVGYPVVDTDILLLDEAGQPVGPNEIGEVAVRSRYLSPGYWRRPDLTQKAFLPDEDVTNFVYKMGDLGRFRPDGCLEYLGRKDFQVKIRGYRVEIGEIEAALHNLSAVKEAVVVAQEGRSGDPSTSLKVEKRLVAYIVPSEQPGPTSSSLRSALTRVLPDYMLPAHFVTLEALPLTPNGKLDQKRLPDPGRARPDQATPFVAPRNPLEEKLANIWAEVLDIEQVGIYDNFLDLGGHSLLATQLVSRVLNIFQVELSPRTLLNSATVATMAALIGQSQASLANEEDLEQILGKLETLSEEEAQRLLAEESE